MAEKYALDSQGRYILNANGKYVFSDTACCSIQLIICGGSATDQYVDPSVVGPVVLIGEVCYVLGDPSMCVPNAVVDAQFDSCAECSEGGSTEPPCVDILPYIPANCGGIESCARLCEEEEEDCPNGWKYDEPPETLVVVITGANVPSGCIGCLYVPGHEFEGVCAGTKVEVVSPPGLNGTHTSSYDCVTGFYDEIVLGMEVKIWSWNGLDDPCLMPCGEPSNLAATEVELVLLPGICGLYGTGWTAGRGANYTGWFSGNVFFEDCCCGRPHSFDNVFTGGGCGAGSAFVSYSMHVGGSVTITPAVI